MLSFKQALTEILIKEVERELKNNFKQMLKISNDYELEYIFSKDVNFKQNKDDISFNIFIKYAKYKGYNTIDIKTYEVFGIITIYGDIDIYVKDREKHIIYKQNGEVVK